jgi:hypothetical protein
LPGKYALALDNQSIIAESNDDITWEGLIFRMNLAIIGVFKPCRRDYLKGVCGDGFKPAASWPL